MIISDISQLEIAPNDNNVVGGAADADAYASASAFGRLLSDAYTSTYTSATSFLFWYSSSYAGSNSHARAI